MIAGLGFGEWLRTVVRLGQTLTSGFRLDELGTEQTTGSLTRKAPFDGDSDIYVKICRPRRIQSYLDIVTIIESLAHV